MTASLNNLGFTSCAFKDQAGTTRPNNTEELYGEIEKLLSKLELQYQLEKSSDQTGKFANLTTNHDGQDYRFFLFQSEENDMNATRIIPETDGFSLDSIQGEFSKKLHSDLQKIAKTIHTGSNSDLTLSIEPEFSPNSPKDALRKAQHARHLVLGKKLVQPIVNRMETLDDGSVEILSNDNPANNKITQALTNMPKVLLEGLMNLKKGVAGIFSSSA